MAKKRTNPVAVAAARRKMMESVSDSTTTMDPEMEATLRQDMGRREKVKVATGGGRASSSGNWFTNLFKKK